MQRFTNAKMCVVLALCATSRLIFSRRTKHVNSSTPESIHKYHIFMFPGPMEVARRIVLFVMYLDLKIAV